MNTYEVRGYGSKSNARYTGPGSTHISMYNEGNGIAKLHSIYAEVPGEHWGSVLMLCACVWATNMGLGELIGGFTPIEGSEESASRFYANRNISVNGKNLSGDISSIARSCTDSMARHQIKYILI
jgi:hypothetical protein